MELIFLRQAYKFIRKADKWLKAKIKEECLIIQENPYKWEKLKWILKEILSHHFIYSKNHYRIAYKVIDNVIVIAIWTRENFYKGL